MTRPGVLYAVVCGAGPASEVEKLVAAAQSDGWDVHLVATPAGLDFIDVGALESITGHPVRSEYRSPAKHRQLTQPPDVIIVAPATYNTMNKLAGGVADNYALGLLAEWIGLGIPVVILPFINSALASRQPLQGAAAALRAEGISVLLGPGEFEPHPAGQGGSRIVDFPWTRALAVAARRAAAAPSGP